MRNLVVVWLAVGLVVLMGLFPPWVGAYPSGEESIGYHFIGLPPKAGEGYAVYQTYGIVSTICLDWSRLVLQWLVVAFTAGGMLYTFNRPGSRMGNVERKEKR